jgi:hypothetical protein
MVRAVSSEMATVEWETIEWDGGGTERVRVADLVVRGSAVEGW